MVGWDKSQHFFWVAGSVAERMALITRVRGHVLTLLTPHQGGSFAFGIGKFEFDLLLELARFVF